MRIKVNTYFDITETSINRVYKGQNLPAKINGKLIKTEEDWNIKRRQQNNLETIIQVLSMRGTPVKISLPECKDGIWSFMFEVDNGLVYGTDLELLKQELIGIPMIIGLSEKHKVDQFLNNDNIWFETDV